ncbi:MAG: gluconate 2-dehydrogenase subunit 3 family protein [Gemmatimonadetes bacterium]|nr:gluconate 2-dehydrogenase subunit 3 family protein [Gemmatimonadota bacterium]MBI2403285.1 gluconate 2-dehydrogenase subunit 3 family protein [Gemmatimonadota bacterium]MBI2535463.1 gluconate 2-dehydrogenase subunit 3 family protein [Gemmatimonadota bacterium]
MDRREALRRASLLLGGAVSAPTLAALLAACDAGGVPGDTAALRVLTPEQAELLATIAEHILPETDTPGARAAGVHRFIDTMLALGYPERERQGFLAGLAEVDALAERTCGQSFLACGAREQRAMLERLDGDADPFFRTTKELTIVGYYTSEIGATRELRHLPVPGRYEGCVPLAQIGRTWAV